MSIQKVNVEQKLAQIKAMGGDKNIVDTVQEQFQLSVFYNEVNLNPQKYSYEDRQKVNKCIFETKNKSIEKANNEIIKLHESSNKDLQKVLDELEKLGVSKENIKNIEQYDIDDIIDLLNKINNLLKDKFLNKSQRQEINKLIGQFFESDCQCNKQPTKKNVPFAMGM